jgi:hypothetical protein
MGIHITNEQVRFLVGAAFVVVVMLMLIRATVRCAQSTFRGRRVLDQRISVSASFLGDTSDTFFHGNQAD